MLKHPKKSRLVFFLLLVLAMIFAVSQSAVLAASPLNFNGGAGSPAAGADNNVFGSGRQGAVTDAPADSGADAPAQDSPAAVDSDTANTPQTSDTTPNAEDTDEATDSTADTTDTDTEKDSGPVESALDSAGNAVDDMAEETTGMGIWGVLLAILIIAAIVLLIIAFIPRSKK